MPEHDAPARSPAGTLASGPFERRDQSLTEGATMSEQEETSARVTSQRQSTSTSPQCNIHIPAQEDGAPGPEGNIGLSMEMAPMRPLAESSLSYTKQTTSSSEGNSTEVIPEVPPLNHSVEPSVQSSTLQGALPEGRDSTGITAVIPPISAPIEHGTRPSAPLDVAPDLEAFFEKYRSLMEPKAFDDFRSTLGRERNFWMSLLTDEERGVYEFRRWTPSRVKQLRQQKRDILLIEDADINCIMALDAEFGLDPQFILNYVGCGQFSSHVKERKGEIHYEGQFHHGNTGMAGSWYVTHCKTQGQFPWRQCNSSRTAWQSVPKFWDRDEAMSAKRPWWMEGCRQTSIPYEQSTEIESKIACYCLSDDLRLFLAESTPQLSSQIARPFDLGMRFRSVGSSGTIMRMTQPVSLEHLTTGQPFAVFLCLRSVLERSKDLSPDLEVERLTSRELALYGDKQGSNDWDALNKVVCSTWTLATCQWQANLDYLKDTFRRRRFDALARPGMRTYLPLIHLRQLIVGMRDHLPHAQQDSRLLENDMEADEPLRLSLPPSNLSKKLAQIAEDIDKLDKELNDEIHLIIGAVTVQDSDANKEQTERATLLTLLAAVYLPLTLVTGIFGMNITDIEEGKPSWQACGQVLAVVAICTMTFVVVYQLWRGWRRGQRDKERMEFDFDKDV